MTAKPPRDARALREACGQLERTLEKRTLELERASSQIADLQAVAAAAGKSKARFLANVSHELRTPMNGVLGMAELLNDTALTAEQRDYIDVLTSSARSLLRVVDDMLDYSEIESGSLALERETFHLHRCIGDILRQLAPVARAKGVGLVGYVDPGLPELVAGDLARLRQIVSNLTADAIAVTPAGDVTLEFQTPAAAPSDGRLHLHGIVRDSGTALAPEGQPLMFSPVAPGEPTAVHRPSGARLGLTIAHRLVEMMGGRLWVESAPEQRTAFHFTLALDAVPGQPSLSDTYRGRLSGAHGLIAIDHAATRRAVGLTLERAGMAVTLIETAETSRRLRARGLRIDVAVLGLPDAADISAMLADIHAASPALPVLLLASPQDSARCRELPVYAFLAMPVPAPSLLSATAAALTPSGPDAPHRPGRRERFRGMRVLVAEDNPINQQVITLMLEGWGASVTVAASGREALAALDCQPFDLVLMDVQMPDGDGFETTAAIRAREVARHTRLPIVALTAQREDRTRCLASGMDDYLAKPVVPAELAEALERAVAADGRHA